MNLETRKILFVQEFLKLQHEEVISRLEKFLEPEKRALNESEFVKEPEFEPMTKKALNARIEQSEADFRNNRFKSSSELISKYKKQK